MNSKTETYVTQKKCTLRESCPAGLLCIQHKLGSVYICTTCKKIVVYFGRYNDTSGKLRAVLPACAVAPLKIVRCRECADDYMKRIGNE